jgi:hypothetical protein
MQEHRQRVARSAFCPDAGGSSNQIQIKCCRRAAPRPPKGPKLEQVNVSFVARLPLKAALCR